MRSLIPIILLASLWGCAPATPDETPDRSAPVHPGVNVVDSTRYEGAAFLPAAGDLVFTDGSTSSLFNLAGQAYDGPLAGSRTQLGQLPAVTAFWFAWSVHYPGARVWNNRDNNEDDEIQASASCAVPCGELYAGCSGNDCIPSIDAPVWVPATGSAFTAYLSDDDRVLGLVHGPTARAYPLDALWRHEIVNDTLADRMISVTYCPLTGSGVLVEGVQAGQAMRFGVSGDLFNSNLVMYDRTTDTRYGQMRPMGFVGERAGEPLETAPLTDTTWGAWRRMFPHTQVLSSSVGVDDYPYGDYRTDHGDTFSSTHPSPDPLYPNKSYAIGITVQSQTVIYAFDEMEAVVGPVAIVQDTIGTLPVLVAFDARTQTAAVYSRLVEGEEVEFEEVD